MAEVASLATAQERSGLVFAGSRAVVFHSVDGGERWTAAELPGAAGIVRTLLVDPRVGETLFALDERSQLFRSDNAGQSWQAVNSEGGQLLTALALNPVRRNRLYSAGNDGVWSQPVELLLPTATPTATPSPTPTPSATPTATPTTSPTATGTATPYAHRHTYRHSVANRHIHPQRYPDPHACAGCDSYGDGNEHWAPGSFAAGAADRYAIVGRGPRSNLSTAAHPGPHRRAHHPADAPAAMNINYARLRSNELRYSIPVKWLLLAIGAWQLTQGAAVQVQAAVGLYALFTVATTVYFASPLSGRLHATWPYWLSQLADVLFVTALIALDEGVASPLYLFYPVLALKSLVYGPDARWLVWLPFAYGPLYALALVVSYGSLGFLADPLFLTRYLLLLLLIFGIAGASLVLAGRLSEVDRLQVALAARSEDLAAQARALQRTATDLGDRVLELRALQEVAKALSATLYLNDTLRTIADRLSRLVESPYCAVALLDGQRQAVSSIVAPDGAATPLARPAGDE